MQTAPIKDLIGHLDALLNPSAFADYGPNGLQVPGKDRIGTVVTGVSASVELFEHAAEHERRPRPRPPRPVLGLAPAPSTPSSSAA